MLAGFCVLMYIVIVCGILECCWGDKKLNIKETVLFESLVAFGSLAVYFIVTEFYEIVLKIVFWVVMITMAFLTFVEVFFTGGKRK